MVWSAWLKTCGKALQKLNRNPVNRIFLTRLLSFLFVPRSYRLDSHNVTTNLLLGKFSIWEMTWIVSDWSGKSVLMNNQVYGKTFSWFIPQRLNPPNHVILQVKLPFLEIQAIGFLFWPICVRRVSSNRDDPKLLLKLSKKCIKNMQVSLPESKCFLSICCLENRHNKMAKLGFYFDSDDNW